LRVSVYIDGFNFFHGAVEGTPYRWLDFRAFSERLLRDRLDDFTIGCIRYFTALVDDRAGNGAPERQAAYWRALRAHDPAVDIILGEFKTRTERRRLASGDGYARIRRSEEKGTDVNLGAYLLVDGFDQRYDLALVVSNDSDLIGPISLVRSRLALAVAVAPPLFIGSRPKPNLQLESSADLTIRITKAMRADLRAAQLPARIADDRGSVTRPHRWDPPPEWAASL
jgi:hypothetical protein